MQCNYTLKRSRRRKNSAALMVKPGGEVVVRAPLFMPKFIIDRFVKEKEGWIKKRQIELQKPKEKRVKHWHSDAELCQFIIDKIAKHEAKMGLYSNGVRFKRVRSYWGTCAPSGALTFNLELIYAPASAVEYVIVHELSHLKYRGHGKRFWDLVERYCETTKESRKILRETSRRNTL